MTRTTINKLGVSAAALAAGLGLAGAAQAQVTAQQVWDDWKAGMTPGGNVTVGSENLQGGVLTVTDLGFTATGEDGTVVAGTLPSLTFTEAGDGTVAITVAPEYPITISSPGDPAAGEPPTEVALAVRQSGMTVTASGQPGALSYDFAAPRLAVELDGVTQAGAAVPAEALLAFNDVAGSYASTTGATRDVSSNATAGSLDLLVDVTNPEDGSAFSLSGQIQDVATRADASLPLDMATAPEMAMMNGMAVDGGYTFGPANYIFEVTDASGTMNGTATSQGGEINFDLSRESMAYDARSRGVAFEATGTTIPFPVSASIAGYGVNVLVPTARTEAPAPWTLGFNLADLDVNDEVWALFDPAAVLPRDPATVILSLSGTATLLRDLMDPAQAEATDAPGEVNSISIDDLNVSVAGAEVTGTGSFTLDNADLTTFGGMPRPEGSAEFQLNGVNGLIDKLAQLGFIPPDQVMGARMMLGLIAVPGAGEDQLTSRIEVTPDGQVLANGQRLR